MRAEFCHLLPGLTSFQSIHIFQSLLNWLKMMFSGEKFIKYESFSIIGSAKIEIKPNIAQDWKFVKKPAITLRNPYDYPTIYRYENFRDFDGPRNFSD